MTTDQVVAVARAWIGTPYVHQASVRGFGTDCLGLILGVWREVLSDVPERVPPYTMDWSEPQGEERLMAACRTHLRTKSVEDEAEGDVILFRMRVGSVAKHLGIQTRIGADGRFVHAYSGHGVIETSLSAPWHRRVVGRFAFPLTEERG